MIHHVYANRSNIGDWLSARAIQSLLAPHAVAEHLCDEPFVPGTLAALAELSPDDLIVIGGGGLFMDYFEPFWEGFRAIARRVPFCVWGVGYCDLKREPSRPSSRLLEDIVSRARLCVVRDGLSRGLLGACHLPDPVPCPSMALMSERPAAGRGLLHVDNYTTAGADVHDAMDAAGAAFASATRRPHVKTNNRIEPGDERALLQILKLYARSDLVLSSALHGCVIAVSMGRPVLAVSGDWKIEAFMQAAGLGDWVCDIGEATLVPERLLRLDGQPSTGAFAHRAREANRAVAARVLAIAREIKEIG